MGLEAACAFVGRVRGGSEPPGGVGELERRELGELGVGPEPDLAEELGPGRDLGEPVPGRAERAGHRRGFRKIIRFE
jgi:hypothetical protein